MGWMLENASLSVGALRWVVQEILADRCEILSAKALFLLEFVRAVSKATTLLFLTVFAVLAVKPEPAQFCPDLLLPPVFSLDDHACIYSIHSGLLGSLNNSWGLGLDRGLIGLLACNVADRRVESSHLRCHVIHIIIRKVAVLRRDRCTVGNWARCIVVCLLLNLAKRQHSHLLRLDFSGRVIWSALGVGEWLHEIGLALLEILLRCR